MKRIADAAAQTLYNARYYLARLPIADQNMSVNSVTNQLTNEAIPVLFTAEYHVRNEFSQE